MNLGRKKCMYLLFMIHFILLFAGCKNARSEKTESPEEKSNYIVNDTIVLVEKRDKIRIKEKITEDISDFDTDFIQKVFYQENIVLKNGTYNLKKTFLLTETEDEDGTITDYEFFVYKLLFNSGEGVFPDLSEKLLHENYITICPVMEAPHTCYLFMDKDQYFIIGYNGLVIVEELPDSVRISGQIDVEYLIEYVKKWNKGRFCVKNFNGKGYNLIKAI